MPSPKPEPVAVIRRGFQPDRLAVPLALVLLAALAIPRLPPGICFGDPGDLQVASATLGFAHPPGYGGFASIGYLLTLIHGLEPAYAVTLGCLASGLVALACIAGLQIRLGLNAWVAAALTLALAATPRFWEALIVPEVYTPNLALHAAAVWFFVRYVQTGRRPRLFVAALLLGFALANRPSALLSVPGFGLALFIYWQQNPPARKKWLSSAVLSLAGLALPCIYVLGYYYVRDCPDAPFNTIEHRHIEHGDLPAATAGPTAKLERVIWLASGREYSGLLGGTWNVISGRGHWLVERIQLSNDALMIAATCAAVLGAALVWRRCRPAAVALIGIALGAVVFFCGYQVHDTAADVLPVMLTAAVFTGVCLSVAFPTRPRRPIRICGILLFVAAGVWAGVNARQPLPDADPLDATHYTQPAELRTLPQNAAVLSAWETSTPLRYAQYQQDRPDLMILTPKPSDRSAVAARLSAGGRGRPVFCTLRIAPPPGHTVVPSGELWHVRPVQPADSTATAPHRDDGVTEGGAEK